MTEKLKVKSFINYDSDGDLPDDYEEEVKNFVKNSKKYYPDDSLADDAFKDTTPDCDYSTIKVIDLIDGRKYEEAKAIAGLTRYDDTSFFRVLGSLVALPEFQKEYGIDERTAGDIYITCAYHLKEYSWPRDSSRDLHLIWSMFN